MISLFEKLNQLSNKIQRLINYSVVNIVNICAISDVGTDVVSLVRTALGNNAYYQLLYSDIAYYLFSFILPLTLLAVFNTRLILTYRGVGVPPAPSYHPTLYGLYLRENVS